MAQYSSSDVCNWKKTFTKILEKFIIYLNFLLPVICVCLSSTTIAIYKSWAFKEKTLSKNRNSPRPSEWTAVITAII